MSSRLEKLIDKQKARRRKLGDRLAAIRSQLIDMGAVKIILFGSFAAGHADIGTDLDLLVVMPSVKGGKEWMGIIYAAVERGVAADMIVYNADELEAGKAASSFLRHVLDSGKVLYEKTV